MSRKYTESRCFIIFILFSCFICKSLNKLKNRNICFECKMCIAKLKCNYVEWKTLYYIPSNLFKRRYLLEELKFEKCKLKCLNHNQCISFQRDYVNILF